MISAGNMQPQKWSASDSFLRADENPLAGGLWANDAFWGPCQLVSNNAVSADADSGVSYWNRTTKANQFSQGRAGASVNLSAPACRYTAGGNAYFLFLNGTTALSLQRYNAGAGTVIQNFGAEVIVLNTSIVRLEALGAGATVTLRVYIDGVQRGSDLSDSDAGRLISGQVGVHGYQAVNGLSNWAGGEL